MKIEENITKKNDLSVDDSLSSFMNHAAQQSHNAYEVFYNFLKEIKPSRILEIGTAMGGFTTFLKICSDELQLDIKILSYDIADRSWYKDMISNGIDVRVEDVFDFVNFTVNPEVIDFINQDGISIVLCDGGWKKGEFIILSNHLKQGDFILAHDYAENSQVFEEKIKNKIWNWHEIQESDIIESSIKNNLKTYNKDIFENAAWVCKIKIK